jgi:hypothetical protein
MHNNFANTITSSSYDDNLSAPDICVLAPVVCDRIVKPCAEASQQSQSDNSLQVLEHGAVFCRKYVSTRRVAPEQDEGKRQRRVKDGQLEKA